jgi:tetratricopeptide (TPR) repeat protein
LELCAGLYLFWFKRGHFHEALRWVGRALERQAFTADSKNLSAECWSLLSISSILTGKVEDGLRALETGLRLAREIGDDFLVVVALRMRVHGLVEAGHLEEAEACAAEAIALGERTRVASEKATALGAAGIIRRAAGDYDEAARYFRQEMAMWREARDDWALAASAADAAEAEMQRGNVEAARSLTLDTLEHVDPNEAPNVAWNLEVLGRALAAREHGLPAAQVWGAAEALFERIGLKNQGYWVRAREEALRAARTALDDDEAFTAAWRQGRHMTIAEAVATARLAE